MTQQPVFVIYRSVNREGATYAVDPSSRDLIKEKIRDGLHLRARVFISHETKADYESIHEDIVPQIVQLLTGLTVEQLQAFRPIVFRDPATERDLLIAAA